MANLPRPLIGLLVATVAFFAVWTVALKPSSSNGPVSASKSTAPAASPAASQPKPATPKDATASHAGRASSAASTAPASAAKPVAKPAVKHTASAQERQNVIKSGLTHHKVVAILFFNPGAADDQAVKHELDAIPSSGGKVVKLAVPLAELSHYPVITNQLQVTESPTLVLIDGKRKADMLTGFLDQFELTQRVSDALAVK